MRQVFNPFIPLNDYIADGEPHVFDKRIYIFGSHDKEGGKAFCPLDYVTYSAPVDDLTDWRQEGVIYKKDQDPDANPKRSNLYAPDVVKGKDGRYYLYYCLEGFEGPISVAVCDTPAGKYEYYGFVRNPDGSRFLRKIPFDPSVINDEGTIRLYYGWSLASTKPENAFQSYALRKTCELLFKKSRKEIETEPGGIMGSHTVILADDMLTVISEPVEIIPNRIKEQRTGFEGHAFYEGSSIRKIKDTYYFIYSSIRNHELCYATSKYPDKDFVYRGTIISNGDVGIGGRMEKDRLNMTATNHGSIECVNGRWYVFYHRNTHGGRCSRQICAEPIEIGEDGSITQVEVSSCGLNGKPLLGKGVYPAVIACNLTNGKMPHLMMNRIVNRIPQITNVGEERFITNIGNETLICYKFFDLMKTGSISLRIRGNAKGIIKISKEMDNQYIAQVEVKPNKKIYIITAQYHTIAGSSALYFRFYGKGKLDFISLQLQ